MSVEKNGKMEIDIKRYARVEKVCVCTGAHSCMQKQPSAHILSCVYFILFLFFPSFFSFPPLRFQVEASKTQRSWMV